MNNHFSVIIPTRNAEEEITRCLYSIWAQTHTNWSAIVIDDNSTDNTVSEINRFLEKFESAKDRITVIENDNQYHALANILTGISMCDHDDIICHVDGDDWLCDMDAFSIINEQYNHQELKIGAVWTNQRWGFTLSGISNALPQDANAYEYQWVTSHLKTFRKYLVDDINMENFYDENGKYFTRVADQALYLPILEICRRSELARTYIPICAYHYNISKSTDFESDDVKLQEKESTFLRNRGFIV